MLIDSDTEVDIAAVLAAEDEAIRRAAAGLPVEDDGTFALPDSLSHLLRADDGREPQDLDTTADS